MENSANKLGIAAANSRGKEGGMELKDFIKNALVEIAEGVRAANKEISIEDPDGRRVGYFEIERVDTKGASNYINFDIAVTTSEEKAGKVGAGLLVASLGLGGQKSNAIANEIISRIKFQVNVKYDLF